MKKSAKKINVKAIIEKNNAIWKASNKMQKRVLLAQDVINQIKAQKYVAQSGCWAITNFEDKNYDKQVSLQEELIKPNGVQCECCALGGLMLSSVKYNNNVNIDKCYNQFEFIDNDDLYDEDHNTDQKMSRQLHDVFDTQTLEKIETWFEDGYGRYKDDSFKLSGDKYDLWRGMDEDNKLISLMENIIEGKGYFSSERQVKKLSKLKPEN